MKTPSALRCEAGLVLLLIDAPDDVEWNLYVIDCLTPQRWSVSRYSGYTAIKIVDQQLNCTVDTRENYRFNLASIQRDH